MLRDLAQDYSASIHFWPQLCRLDHVRSCEAGSRHTLSAGPDDPLTYLETLLKVKKKKEEESRHPL